MSHLWRCFRFSSRMHPSGRLRTLHRASLSSLAAPAILYSSNHLLVVNKPAGWHIHGRPLDKSLVPELQRKKLGGGSLKNFLLPLHRIDQPCTGVVLLAKTSKAATRLQKLWKRGKVTKEYLCILESSDALQRLRQQSTPVEGTEDDDWRQLAGWLSVSREKGATIKAVSEEPTPSGNYRECHVWWKCVLRDPNMIRVKTERGARHMVRSLLGSLAGTPISGDLRYGASQPLPDRSVALHAWSVTLPETLQLGSEVGGQSFVAPLPKLWMDLFGICEKRLQLGGGNGNNSDNRRITSDMGT